MSYNQMMAPMQTAEDLEPLLPSPAAVMRLGPVLLDDDWIARNEGWASYAERQLAVLDLMAHAWTVVREREAIGDHCMDALDVQEALVDRVLAGHAQLRAVPELHQRSAIRSVARQAARAAWSEIERARRDADELALAIEADRAHRWAEEVAA